MRYCPHGSPMSLRQTNNQDINIGKFQKIIDTHPRITNKKIYISSIFLFYFVLYNYPTFILFSMSKKINY